MLSKKLSDYIFIGAVLFIIITVFVVRILILNQYDSRIENAENDIIRLESQITQVSALVDDNRNDQLSSMVEMYQVTPSEYNGGQLVNYVYGMLELSNIKRDNNLLREVSIQSSSLFPDDSDFRNVPSTLTPYRFRVNVEVESFDYIEDFIDRMHNSEQLFIIETFEYTIPEESVDPIEVNLYFITYYNLDDPA